WKPPAHSPEENMVRQKCSGIRRSYLDARDLEAAVNANWDANAECLKNEYGMSNEKIEEIRAKLHKLNRNVGLY
ncbi:hypothetical protein ACR916_23870, partial [Klebsiella pneumoniae]|nr:hypothetical protein [Klebsiella pneumoniae]